MKQTERRKNEIKTVRETEKLSERNSKSEREIKKKYKSKHMNTYHALLCPLKQDEQAFTAGDLDK